MEATVLRLRDVRARVGLSKSQIYALIARNEFPRPFKLSVRASGWYAQAIRDWIERRKAAA